MTRRQPGAEMHAAERRLLTRWHREVTVPEHGLLGDATRDEPAVGES